ncbi:MAG: hypothetical protein IH989_02115 [Planctomycetes bacterium]|nr:hypothetical protein [Planctomycetota bacterium]
MAIAEINWNPTTRDLRQFGMIWLPAFLVLVGVIAFYYGESMSAAVAPAALALTAAVTGYLRPCAIRPVFVGLMGLTFPIGWVVSHAIFLFVFYFVVTPIGLLMRLAGRDALERKLDRTASTYWQPYQQETSRARYVRQF